jgi:hypothetical protein
MLSGESYYPRHATHPVDELRITADYQKARYDPLVIAARSAFGPTLSVQEFDSSDYERPLPPPCLRVAD